MPRARRCSECPNTLEGKPPQTKTCSGECRTKRSRRLSAEKKDIGRPPMPEHQRELTQIVRGEKDDVSRRIVEEELRPVVKEAITEDVLRGIQDLIGLVPETVQAVGEDLRSEDAVIRQRAEALVLKYTLGNASVAPSDDDSGTQLVVNIETPRPQSESVEAEEVEEVTDELNVCDKCLETKPADEFVDGSDRCRSCWEKQRAEVQERYGLGEAT